MKAAFPYPYRAVLYGVDGRVIDTPTGRIGGMAALPDLIEDFRHDALERGQQVHRVTLELGVIRNGDLPDQGHCSPEVPAQPTGNGGGSNPVADDPDQATRIERPRCAGNGEIVTDWEVYLHPWPDAPGEAEVEDCPDCDGIGSTPAV